MIPKRTKLKNAKTEPRAPTAFAQKISAILNHNSQFKPSNQARLPASGEENERCGEISAIHKCMVCGNTYPLYHSCHRIECPICYNSAAARIGQRASVKTRANIKAIDKEITPKPAKDVYGREQKDAGLWDQAYNKTEAAKLHAILKHGGVRHLVVSVPPSEREKWQEFSNRQMIEIVNKHIDRYLPRILGSTWIYHPYRIDPEILQQLKEFRWKNPERSAYVSKRDGETLAVNQYNTKKLAKKTDDPEATTYGKFGFWADVFDDVLNLGNSQAYTVFSPHIHMLYSGTVPRADEYHQQTKGWIYKNVNGGRSIQWEIEETEGKPLKDHLAKSITYLASHAGVFETKKGRSHDIIHYTRIFSPKSSTAIKDQDKKQEIEKVYKTYVDCEQCGTGNHLTLCDKDTEEPIIGINGEIYAHDKIVIPKKELTQNGKRTLQWFLNYNWAVSRIQSEGYGITPAQTPNKTATNTPDPPPQRA